MKYTKILPGLYLFLFTTLFLILSPQISNAQDYDGKWCNATIKVNNNSGKQDFCLILQNYDGKEVGLYFIYKEGGDKMFIEMLDMVSPGVFETKAAARGGVNFFKGTRVTYINANKVIYEGYGNANGSLIEKIIYTN
ncbi:MAG: hypothetical protein JST55_14735 [Bacteroidetes bacterium]|nr:hypothetical protein [Bacteroidota bacterium]